MTFTRRESLSCQQAPGKMPGTGSDERIDPACPRCCSPLNRQSSNIVPRVAKAQCRELVLAASLLQPAGSRAEKTALLPLAAGTPSGDSGLPKSGLLSQVLC